MPSWCRVTSIAALSGCSNSLLRLLVKRRWPDSGIRPSLRLQNFWATAGNYEAKYHRRSTSYGVPNVPGLPFAWLRVGWGPGSRCCGCWVLALRQLKRDASVGRATFLTIFVPQDRGEGRPAADWLVGPPG